MIDFFVKANDNSAITNCRNGFVVDAHMVNQSVITMKSVHVFIISWPGQHKNAIKIAEQIRSVAAKVTIVYSDSNNDFSLEAECNLVRRPNELFWEDKFSACLDACGDDAMLVIHADCDCEDWSELINAYLNASSSVCDLGVWAPNISYTPYRLDSVKIARINFTPLWSVALIDGIVFALSPVVIKRMREVNYNSNPFGWGISRLFCSASYLLKQWVVIDESIKVRHPRGSGYDSQEAKTGMNDFLKQFLPLERVQLVLLFEYVRFNRIKLNNKR